MAEPIALTDANIQLLRGPELALAVVGLDPLSDDPRMLSACVQYLMERASQPEEQAWRIVEALREIAAAR